MGNARKFAVIVGGSKSFIGAIEEASRTLFVEEGYNIYVAAPEKPKFFNIFNDGYFSDCYFPATKAGVNKLIDTVAKEITADDDLVIFTVGHGGLLHDEPLLCLEDGCIRDEFLKELEKVNYGRRYVVMDQCFCGNWKKYFSDSKTKFYSAAEPNQLTCNSLYASYFWEKKIPDADNDGNVSFDDRDVYAKKISLRAALAVAGACKLNICSSWALINNLSRDVETLATEDVVTGTTALLKLCDSPDEEIRVAAYEVLPRLIPRLLPFEKVAAASKLRQIFSNRNKPWCARMEALDAYESIVRVSMPSSYDIVERSISFFWNSTDLIHSSPVRAIGEIDTNFSIKELMAAVGTLRSMVHEKGEQIFDISMVSYVHLLRYLPQDLIDKEFSIQRRNLNHPDPSIHIPAMIVCSLLVKKLSLDSAAHELLAINSEIFLKLPGPRPEIIEALLYRVWFPLETRLYKGGINPKDILPPEDS